MSTIRITNSSGVKIVVHLDAIKPPCGVGKSGACNPPGNDGSCKKDDASNAVDQVFFPATAGTIDEDYDTKDCFVDTSGDSKFAKGDLETLWSDLDGPFKSGVKFQVEDINGKMSGGERSDIKPYQVLEPGETWVITLPVSPDGSNKTTWCYAHENGTDMVCSGTGGSFTPYSNTEGVTTVNLNAPVATNRFEFNINSKSSYPNWVLNTSAVDGLNSKMSGSLNSTACDGGKALEFKCNIDLDACPTKNKGNPYLSVQGENVIYPSCLAPKNFGLPQGAPIKFNNTPQIDGCSDPTANGCWAGANGSSGSDKLMYHQAWDLTSKSIKPEAKAWQQFIRPGPPDSKKICQTYAWAYDEQVCDTKEYSGNGQCTIKDNVLHAPDNPYAPLGTCKVYDESGKYVNPNIQINLHDIMTRDDVSPSSKKDDESKLKMGLLVLLGLIAIGIIIYIIFSTQK